MAKKADIITFFNSTLTVVINIVKVKLCLNKILDNFYSAEVVDTSTAQTYTTAESNTYFPYSLRLNKQGGITKIDGTIANLSTLISSNQRIFEFKPSEYMPKEDSGAIGATVTAKGIAVDQANGNQILLQITNDVDGTYLEVVGTFPTNDTGKSYSIVSLTYNTKE